jgi:hypothetical protein
MMVQCAAFAGTKRIAAGPLAEVAAAAKAQLARAPAQAVLVFDDATGRAIDLDLRGSLAEILARIGPPRERRGPGRPRLGVVAREVTLLPRHWEWLNRQTGGASVALRRLVDAARQSHAGADRVRQAQEAAYRFTTAMAGNEPGYEEALRALFARDRAGFDAWSANWPADVRVHAQALAAPAFGTTE